MSLPSRVSVFAALSDVLQGAYAWQTVSRRLQNAQDMQPETMPAAFQVQGNQATEFKGDTPAVGDWQATWILYASTNDESVAPSTTLNAMVDAALAALAPAQ